MSNIWARSPDLFIYTKGNEVYLWRCNKTTWMPMIGQDFDVVAQIIDHQALMGEDSLFDWDKKYYDDMISYISPRRLLVNNRGLVIVELRKFGQDGKLDENDQLPFYVRSFDVMSLKPYNLRDRTIPSRTVRYLGGEGRAAPVEDSNVPSSSGNITTTTTTTTSDDQKKWDEKWEALEKQVKELTDANKTLNNDNIELRDANKTLKSEKEAAEKQASDLNEAAEKQASDLNDRNKILAEKRKKTKQNKKKTLAEDVEAQKTAAENALQERNDAKRDKEAPEQKAVELQTEIDNKKEGWMNDVSDSGWSRAEYLQPYIHHGVSGDYTTFRVVVVGERGTFTVDDNTTNVRASYLYGVKIIDHDGNFDINLQRATKEYKAVKLEDLNPGKEKARFGRSKWEIGSNWVRGMFNGDTYVIKEINFFCLVD